MEATNSGTILFSTFPPSLSPLDSAPFRSSPLLVSVVGRRCLVELTSQPHQPLTHSLTPMQNTFTQPIMNTADSTKRYGYGRFNRPRKSFIDTTMSTASNSSVNTSASNSTQISEPNSTYSTSDNSPNTTTTSHTRTQSKHSSNGSMSGGRPSRPSFSSPYAITRKPSIIHSPPSSLPSPSASNITTPTKKPIGGAILASLAATPSSPNSSSLSARDHARSSLERKQTMTNGPQSARQPVRSNSIIRTHRPSFTGISAYQPADSSHPPSASPRDRRFGHRTKKPSRVISLEPTPSAIQQYIIHTKGQLGLEPERAELRFDPLADDDETDQELIPSPSFTSTTQSRERSGARLLPGAIASQKGGKKFRSYQDGGVHIAAGVVLPPLQAASLASGLFQAGRSNQMSKTPTKKVRTNSSNINSPTAMTATAISSSPIDPSATPTSMSTSASAPVHPIIGSPNSSSAIHSVQSTLVPSSNHVNSFLPIGVLIVPEISITDLALSEARRSSWERDHPDQIPQSSPRAVRIAQEEAEKLAAHSTPAAPSPALASYGLSASRRRSLEAEKAAAMSSSAGVNTTLSSSPSSTCHLDRTATTTPLSAHGASNSSTPTPVGSHMTTPHKNSSTSSASTPSAVGPSHSPADATQHRHGRIERRRQNSFSSTISPNSSPTVVPSIHSHSPAPTTLPPSSSMPIVLDGGSFQQSNSASMTSDAIQDRWRRSLMKRMSVNISFAPSPFSGLLGGSGGAHAQDRSPSSAGPLKGGSFSKEGSPGSGGILTETLSARETRRQSMRRSLMASSLDRRSSTRDHSIDRRSSARDHAHGTSSDTDRHHSHSHSHSRNHSMNRPHRASVQRSSHVSHPPPLAIQQMNSHPHMEGAQQPYPQNPQFSFLFPHQELLAQQREYYDVCNKKLYDYLHWDTDQHMDPVVIPASCHPNYHSHFAHHHPNRQSGSANSILNSIASGGISPNVYPMPPSLPSSFDHNYWACYSTIQNWETFDIFAWSEYTQGWPLSFMFVVVLKKSDLFRRLKLDEKVAFRFIQEVESHYLPSVNTN